MKLAAKPAGYNFKNNDVAVIFLSEEYEKEIDKVKSSIEKLKDENIWNYRQGYNFGHNICISNFP